MSRRRNRDDATLGVPAARAYEGVDRLRDLNTRAGLLWLAQRQRDVAARETATGRALTGMPRYESRTPSLPGTIGGTDLSGDIARHLNGLVRELLEHGWTPDAPTEAGRWNQAALAWDQHPWTEHERVDWHDDTLGLRRQAERMLGPDARGRWLGPCPVPGCPGEVRMGDDEGAVVCEDCGGFVTREQQQEYIRQEMAGAVYTLSELASALTLLGAPVPFRTLQTWARRGRLPEHVEWAPWRGIPWSPPKSGLYPLRVAFSLATARSGVRVLEESAA